MFTSTRYAHIALRIGLATVFIWFGVDAFLHPAYWLTAWIPSWLFGFLSTAGLQGFAFVYLLGILEVLIAISLLTGIFMKFFALIASLFLVVTILIVGFRETTIQFFGIIGALVAVILWPDRGNRFLSWY